MFIVIMRCMSDGRNTSRQFPAATHVFLDIVYAFSRLYNNRSLLSMSTTISNHLIISPFQIHENSSFILLMIFDLLLCFSFLVFTALGEETILRPNLYFGTRSPTDDSHLVI